jgi:hypothetical protein
VIEGAENIIPDSKTRETEIQQMCADAHMRYIDAATGRPYDMHAVEESPGEKGGGRKIFVTSEVGH